MNVIALLKQERLNESSLIYKVGTKFYRLLNRNKIKVTNGNTLNLNGCLMGNSNIFIQGVGNQIDLKWGGVYRNLHVYIKGNYNKITIGRFSSLRNADLYIEDDNNVISFGEDTHICGYTHVAAIEGCKIEFGDGCLFSTNVIFRVGDSHSILSAETGKRINPSESIKIGNRVWFGNNTTVLKGVIIQDDSIVGTGSIVTKSPNLPNVILAGSPAKIVKENIKWNHKRLSIE